MCVGGGGGGGQRNGGTVVYCEISVNGFTEWTSLFVCVCVCVCVCVSETQVSLQLVISGILPVKISMYQEKICNWSDILTVILFDQFSTTKIKGKKYAEQSVCSMLRVRVFYMGKAAGRLLVEL